MLNVMDHEQQQPRNEEQRKACLETLSKDELVKKCKSLLVIAQKAKLAKDEYYEENKGLKDQLQNYETQKNADKKSIVAMKEFVDSLTEDKLKLVTKLEELEKKCFTYEKQSNETLKNLSKLEIENESLKRRVQRLEKENETLLNNIEDMENKLSQVNKYSVQQKDDLILLEKQANYWKSLERKNIELEEHVNFLNKNFEIFKAGHDSAENNDMKINANPRSNSSSIENYYENEKKDNLVGEVPSLIECSKCNDLQIQVEKLMEKVACFKFKLSELSSKLIRIKRSRNVLKETVKDYSECIPKWQKEIQNASERLANLLASVENENVFLQQKVVCLDEEIQKYKTCASNYQRLLNFLNKITYDLSILSDKSYEEYQKNCEQVQSLENELHMKILENSHTSKQVQHSNKETNETENNCTNEVKNCVISTENKKELQPQIEEIFGQTEFEDCNKALEDHVLEENKVNIMELVNANDLIRNMVTALDEKEKSLKAITSQLVSCEEKNTEMLSEMRELNEALKQRGDVISRQQKTIEEFKKDISNNSEALKKFQTSVQEKDTQIFSMQAKQENSNSEIESLTFKLKERENLIQTLTNELKNLRDIQSDTLSTSTISKVEETIRIKDVDDSLDEKYNKLRVLAIKLKKKNQDQTAVITALESENKKIVEENSSITTKLANMNVQIKNLQAIQLENDKLMDELDILKNENKMKIKEIQDLNNKINSLEKNLSEIKGLNEVFKNDLNLHKKSITSLDTAIKEYQCQIKSLKDEKDSLNIVIKNIEKERDQFKIDLLNTQTKYLEIEENYKITKNDYDKVKAAGKKHNVLSLEIEAYEKSLNEITQKFEEQKILNKKLQDETVNKDSRIKSLSAEIKVLEENNKSEQHHSEDLRSQIEAQCIKLKVEENEKRKLQERCENLNLENENLKSNLDKHKLEIAELISQKQNLEISLNNEKENLLRDIISLNNDLENSKKKLKISESELHDIRTDFASYKIKAQSILRQNQSKESTREIELEEEIVKMSSIIESLNLKIKSQDDIIKNNEIKIDELKEDNENTEIRIKDLLLLLEESRKENEALLEDQRKHNADYQESLRNHRLQIETINSCYKQQIEDMRKKYSKEIQALKESENVSQTIKRMDPFGAPRGIDEQKIDLLLMEREDAEGSENSVQRRKTSTSRTKQNLIPLEELLNSTFDENQNEYSNRPVSPTTELHITKNKLITHENHIKYLTSLLSETEQDLAKLTQLNEVLKEEVRRHERAVEREKHVHNSEYLKNIVLKFLTLNSSDEKFRLVPVLNTMLKLSPEETETLRNVAKGIELPNRGWGSYLPAWTNHS